MGTHRRRHGDLREMLRALTLYPWLNTAEDEKRREAARWALTHWPEYQDRPDIRIRSGRCGMSFGNRWDPKTCNRGTNGIRRRAVYETDPSPTRSVQFTSHVSDTNQGRL